MFKALRLSAICLTAVCLSAFAAVASAQEAPAAAGNIELETTQYEDWEVNCPKNDSTNPCEMTQLVEDPETGNPIMRVVVGYPPQIDSAAMIVLLPLGVPLQPGIQFSVDGGQAQHYPFQVCLEQGCRANFPLDNAVLNRLKNGQSAEVTIVSPQGNQMQLQISLMGFTAANKAIAP